MLEKFDTNHNGVLDPDEKEALKAAREKHREKMLAKFDTNGDGKLEPDEKAAAKEQSKKFHKKHQGQAWTPPHLPRRHSRRELQVPFRDSSFTRYGMIRVIPCFNFTVPLSELKLASWMSFQRPEFL